MDNFGDFIKALIINNATCEITANKDNTIVKIWNPSPTIEAYISDIANIYNMDNVKAALSEDSINYYRDYRGRTIIIYKEN